MNLEPGDRVALIHTADEHTALRPGDQGTIWRIESHPGLAELHAGNGTRDVVRREFLTVYITWDNGSRLGMCPDTGDRIRLIAKACS